MTNKRIYAQYADKPKAVEWLNIVPDIASEMQTTFKAIQNSYDIDANEGEQLNVIGRIVGIDRSFESQVFYEPDTVFGADNDASQFGGIDSQFESTGDNISIDVSDSIFRVLLKAKIAKNNSDASIDGIAHALNYITNSAPISVIDNEDMTFSVSFGTALTDIEKFVFNTFDIIPRPQGVKFLGYVDEESITQFGGTFGWGDNRANFGLYFGV